MMTAKTGKSMRSAEDAGYRESVSPLIVFVASPLQTAVFAASSLATRVSMIVGHRGAIGDVCYKGSVLNAPAFFLDLDRLIGSQRVEVVLPNSLNCLFYFCAADPRVVRISFVDEGRLTKRYVSGGFRKPNNPLGTPLLTAFRLARLLPHSFWPFAYRVLGRLIRLVIIRRYERDTMHYPYRTIERTWKGGVVLSHTTPDPACKAVEKVGFRPIEGLSLDCVGGTCLFLHPRDIVTEAQVSQIMNVILVNSSERSRGFIRPHPLFSAFQLRLQRFIDRLAAFDGSWKIIGVSGRHETTMELYARGMRTFIVADSSLLDTIEALPEYFKGLKIVRI